MDVEMIALIGIFLGVLTRTLLPAIRKWKDSISDPEKAFDWNNKYTATMVVSVLTAVIVTIVAFPQFTIPTSNSVYGIFSGAYIFGIGLTEIIVEITEWAG